MRYGTGSSWVSRSVTNSGTCSNAFFGTDPAYGQVKQCEVSSTAPPPASWTKIANEGQAFTVSGTQTVRYGTGSSWVSRSVTDSGTCSNAFFGTDPAYGQVKQCEVSSTAPPPASNWTTIANEGQSFTVSGTQTVRYGTGSTWLTKSVTNSGVCSNAFFGGDPAYGIFKHCEVAQ